jgi:hypothetical protein
MRALRHRVSAGPAGVSVGVLATLTMDAAIVAAGRLGGEALTSGLAGPDLVGRWAAGMAHGRLWHSDLRAEPALRGEAAVGLAVHYLTGIVLTQAYYEMLRHGGSRPSLAKATAYGIATSVLPLLVMYPSWGLGPCARRSDEAPRMLRVMLLGHTAFGAGIGMWTALLRGHAASS